MFFSDPEQQEDGMGREGRDLRPLLTGEFVGRSSKTQRYRDDEYMILKIYDLPNRKLQVVI